MATRQDARFVQERLGYQFKDEAILCLALTAAGKGGMEDGANKRGNGRLAYLGNFLMQFLLAWIGFDDDRNRAESFTLATQFNSADHCARVAERAELDRCLKYHIRSGSKSAVVLRKALNAIMAAIFVDSRDINQVLAALTNLGLFGHDDFCVDPRLLSSSQTTAVASFPQVVLANNFQLEAESSLAKEREHVAQGNPEPETLISAAIGTEVNNAAAMIPSTAAVQLDEVGGLVEQLNWELTDFLYQPLESLNTYSPSKEFFDNLVVPDMPLNLEIGLSSAHNGIFHRQTNISELETQDKRDGVHVQKKRRYGPAADSSRVVGDNSGDRCYTWLSQYLAEERERCGLYQHSPPEETFFPEHVQKRIQALGKKNLDILLKFQVMTANSNAIATLCEFVWSYQTECDFRHWQITPAISPQTRFNVIKELDKKVALYGLLRRYHALHLYLDCVPANGRATADFINTNPSNFQHKNKAGNSGYNAKSEVTLVMMRQIYPDIDSSSVEYKSRYRAVSKLQTLGRRYLSFADRFGKGVLGLLPLSNLTNSDNMYIPLTFHPTLLDTDKLTEIRIILLPDSVFSQFLDIFDESQGNLLRKFSDAAFCVLKPLLYSTFHGPVLSHIGTYRAEDIIGCPKGSDELLKILM
ncbi:hypothetical protein BDV29DRAFT_196630 [Aspergillus leporis]|uniref:RNase III domain-containing protein n=1 Tax=Aspergillus leporis TaxID=41062 RepID=A0A5N5WJ19_9EURO|nr:hypothetical protein BDV29DRAFT_196630 [Aspergillus leporis]